MKQVCAALALFTTIGVAPAAMAWQSQDAQDANDPVVVRDATGTVVGRLLTEDLMARRYVVSGKSRVVSISFSEQALDNNFVFFYASADCTGNAYVETFFARPVPDRALFEEAASALWGGDPQTQLTLNANSAVYGSGACDPTVVATIIASPVVFIEDTSRGFTPPFRAE